jgi:hypothetical protein
MVFADISSSVKSSPVRRCPLRHPSNCLQSVGVPSHPSNRIWFVGVPSLLSTRLQSIASRLQRLRLPPFTRPLPSASPSPGRLLWRKAAKVQEFWPKQITIAQNSAKIQYFLEIIAWLGLNGSKNCIIAAILAFSLLYARKYCIFATLSSQPVLRTKETGETEWRGGASSSRATKHWPNLLRSPQNRQYGSKTTYCPLVSRNCRRPFSPCRNSAFMRCRK